jgi:hypothetical protein
MNKIFLSFLLTSIFMFSVEAVRKVVYKTKSTKTCTPKAPYSSLGKKSSINNQIKTKPVKGHFKPSNGYKFVNPYARSK